MNTNILEKTIFWGKLYLDHVKKDLQVEPVLHDGKVVSAKHSGHPGVDPELRGYGTGLDPELEVFRKMPGVNLDLVQKGTGLDPELELLWKKPGYDPELGWTAEERTDRKRAAKKRRLGLFVM